MDALRSAKAALAKAEAVARKPVLERNPERVLQHAELMEALRALIAFHEGSQQAHGIISQKAIALASTFYEVRPGTWLLRQDLSRHYRPELNSLCDAVASLYRDT